MNSDNTSYYTPITYVENGKMKTIPFKITYFINPMYKNNVVDKKIFSDYNSCQQYCIEKDTK